MNSSLRRRCISSIPAPFTLYERSGTSYDVHQSCGEPFGVCSKPRRVRGNLLALDPVPLACLRLCDGGRGVDDRGGLAGGIGCPSAKPTLLLGGHRAEPTGGVPFFQSAFRFSVRT